MRIQHKVESFFHLITSTRYHPLLLIRVRYHAIFRTAFRLRNRTTTTNPSFGATHPSSNRKNLKKRTTSALRLLSVFWLFRASLGECGTSSHFKNNTTSGRSLHSFFNSLSLSLWVFFYTRACASSSSSSSSSSFKKRRREDDDDRVFVFVFVCCGGIE